MVNLLVYGSWELGLQPTMLPLRFGVPMAPVGSSSNLESLASHTCIAGQVGRSECHSANAWRDTDREFGMRFPRVAIALRWT